MNNQKHFCCPQCGNKNLQITTQTDSTTTGKNYSAGKGCLGYLLMGPLGLLCGGCGGGQQTVVKETQYWMCPNCGHKFESPDDIRKRAEMLFKNKKSVRIVCIIYAALCLLEFIITGIAGVDLPEAFWIVMITAVVVLTIFSVLPENTGKKLLEEADEIERSMQRFAGLAPSECYFEQNEQVTLNLATWVCPCGSLNYDEDNFCPSCGKMKQ